jgi:hypothetical protein
MHERDPGHRGRLLDSVAFLAPRRMAWLLPLCELALMTDGRAYDINVELDTTVITGRTARWRSGR